MDLEYIRARTRATRLAFEDWLHSLNRCRSRYQNTERRCVKQRRHGAPLHTDGEKAWYDDEADMPVTEGHMHVVEGRRR
jgi:hypothetical protein